MLLAGFQATLNEGTASVTEMPLEFCVIIYLVARLFGHFSTEHDRLEKKKKITLFSDLLGVLSCGMGSKVIVQN